VSKAQIRVNTSNPTSEVQLPAGWRWTTVADVADDTQIGIVRAKAQQNRAGKGVPYLKMNNLTMDGKVTANDIVFVEATQDEINRFSVRAGDILFNTRNSVELVGKTGIVTREASGSIYNNNLMRIRTKPDVSSLFVAYQMCSPDFRRRMERVKRSTTNVAALYAKDVLPLPIALPSIDQQNRIVAEIEKQFSRLDEAVANLKRVKANLKRYKAAVLKAAVEGKLTEEWRKAHPDVEPASELLKRILAERHSRTSSKELYDDVTHLDGRTVFELPEKWVWCKARDVCQVIDPQPSHRTPAEYNGGVPYIGMGDVTPDGKINFRDARKVSSKVFQEHQERYKLKKGDFIFGKIGTLGTPVTLPEPFNYTLSANVVLFQPTAAVVCPDWVFTYMSSSFVTNYLTREGKATSQPAFGIKKVREFPFPLPPIAEQLSIAAEVERRFSIITQLAVTLETNLKRGGHAGQAILNRAFTGGLLQ
jgi:type I restriction enzyme, S subunit